MRPGLGCVWLQRAALCVCTSISPVVTSLSLEAGWWLVGASVPCSLLFFGGKLLFTFLWIPLLEFYEHFICVPFFHLLFAVLNFLVSFSRLCEGCTESSKERCYSSFTHLPSHLLAICSFSSSLVLTYFSIYIHCFWGCYVSSPFPYLYLTIPACWHCHLQTICSSEN